MLIVATDRISAFDVVLPTGIPDKGAILTQISAFWFRELARIVPNHLISTEVADFPRPFHPHEDALGKRSMLVRRAKPLPIECIARGYLSGSGWTEYRECGTVCGMRLPKGLRESDRLPDPIFTPSTKAEKGHDVNISFEEACRILKDKGVARRVRRISLDLYAAASEHAARRGIIIADTKFEFGWCGDELTLIDEVLTPDSSRFWPWDGYEPGQPQESFDKQFVRDYLVGLRWDKTHPGPDLTQEIVEKTRQRYGEALRKLTSKGR